MSVILDQANVLKSVIRDIGKIVIDEAEKHKEFISELNQQQLAEGQTADGGSLPPYSQTSVSSFGKPPGPIKLFDQGDFYEGIEPLFNDEMFEMIGRDDKTDMLASRYASYGPILGLLEESIDKLGEKIKPGIIESIKRRLN